MVDVSIKSESEGGASGTDWQLCVSCEEQLCGSCEEGSNEPHGVLDA